MTDLARPVTRRVTIIRDFRREARPQDRIAVTLYPEGEIGFRESRCRREYRLPLSAAYRMAVEAAVRQEKADKKARKGGVR